MRYTYKSLFLIALSALTFGAASQAKASDLILTHMNGADMSMECMNMARYQKINTPEVHHCRRVCDDFRRRYVNATDFDKRAEQSQACRTAYQNATGKDVEPTLPKDYKVPQHSARDKGGR